MKLAFNGQARYPDMKDGYELYVRRKRMNEPVDIKTYSSVVKEYCKMLAEDLEKDGIIDLPSGIGSIAAIRMTRRPQYRGKKFIGYGKMDWKRGHYDGELKAFGLTFLPSRRKNENLRCYGFVANRRLFKKIKEKYNYGLCEWSPVEFGKEMI